MSHAAVMETFVRLTYHDMTPFSCPSRVLSHGFTSNSGPKTKDFHLYSILLTDLRKLVQVFSQRNLSKAALSAHQVY